MLQVRAKLSDCDISPQKARLVADMIRGNHVEKALQSLQFTQKKAARIIKKILESAIANAENNNGADIDELYVHRIMVDQASSLKRFRARAKGRANRIIKRRSHIVIILTDLNNN